VPRRNRSDKVLRVRFKDNLGMPKTTLRISNDPRNTKGTFGAGRVLRIGKMSPEQIYKVGSWNPLPQQLMREFTEERRRKGLTVLNPIKDIVEK
jgi:hypothetical protein